MDSFSCSCVEYKNSIATMESIVQLLRILSEGGAMDWRGGVKVQEYASMALSNLSNLEENQRAIIKVSIMVGSLSTMNDI